MILTPEQQEILNGEKGKILSKVMTTMVNYGEAFGAEKLVPVTSKYNHLGSMRNVKELNHWA